MRWLGFQESDVTDADSSLQRVLIHSLQIDYNKRFRMHAFTHACAMRISLPVEHNREKNGDLSVSDKKGSR